jgi:DNA polymerase-3 subunit gamma/tau
MYQVLARKWRPQTFAQLVGQPHVSRTLGNAIEQDRLAHAYIFAGLRGTGKTTVARILSKCLNCEKGPTTTPCNECAACSEIAESRAIDVLEIDAASRTKVEQTRELLEVVSYAPVRDRYKILIIDEAHMLSKASFNALLKTLEEPPPNVVFLLATTELPKILPTIHSRCQVFEFRRVAPAEVAGHLRRICDDEKIDVPDAALERLARSGEGSVRDSLSLLERAVAFCGAKIEDEDVLRMLGAVRANVLSEMVAALARRDAAAMLGVLDGLVDEGHDLIHFWNVMIAAVRDLLVERTLPGRRDLLARPPEEAEELIRAAKDLTREDLTRVFQVLADLEPGLRSSGQPRFLFEAALIRLASLGAVRPIEEVLESLEATAPAPRPPAPRQKKKPGEPAAVSPGKPARAVRPDPPPAPSAPPGEGVRAAPVATGDAARLVEAVRQDRPMLAAMLEQSAVEVAGGCCVIRFPAGMEAVKRQVEARQSLTLLRREAERLAGGRVTIRVEVAGPEAVAPDAPPPTPPRHASSPAAPEAAPAPRDPAQRPARVGPGDLLERARSEPGIRKLMETFGAQVVDIRRCERPSKPRRPSRPARGPEDSP